MPLPTHRRELLHIPGPWGHHGPPITLGLLLRADQPLTVYQLVTLRLLSVGPTPVDLLPCPLAAEALLFQGRAEAQGPNIGVSQLGLACLEV